MRKNYEPDRNIEDLSDAEVYATIRYLDPDSLHRNKQNDVAIAIFLISLLFVIGFIWFYR
jgi:hypothetical protein